MSAANDEGLGLPPEPSQTNTTNSQIHVSALVVAYQMQHQAGLLEWYGRYLADRGEPFAEFGMSVVLMARKIGKEATDIIGRAPEAVIKLVPVEVMMPSPPARCPLASSQYAGTCWTSTCLHWRNRMGGVVGTCAFLPEGDAP